MPMSRFTSEPERRFSVGWVGMPAGLLTTAR